MVATDRHEYVPLPALDKATSAKYSGGISTGCYLLNYKPVGNPLLMYDGTLRLEATSGPLLASGDLYTRSSTVIRRSSSWGRRRTPLREFRSFRCLITGPICW